jgi:hypothetical protein
VTPIIFREPYAHGHGLLDPSVPGFVVNTTHPNDLLGQKRGISMPETQSITTTDGQIEGSWNGNVFTLLATPIQKKDGRVNTAYFLRNAETGKVSDQQVKGMSLAVADLPDEITSGVTVPLQRGIVQRKRKGVVVGTHEKVSGNVTALVDGRNMKVEAIISQPKADRLYFNVAITNVAVQEAKPAAPASRLFGR